jgi:hypothetical protein
VGGRVDLTGVGGDAGKEELAMREEGVAPRQWEEHTRERGMWPYIYASRSSWALSSQLLS